MDLENYRVVEKRDCYSHKIYGIILLNKKHNIEDFQNAINEAKNKCADVISEFGNDWYYIAEEIKDEFDYIEIGISSDDYIEF